MPKKIATVLSLIVAFSLTQPSSFTSKAATTCSTKEECNAIISEAKKFLKQKMRLKSLKRKLLLKKMKLKIVKMKLIN